MQYIPNPNHNINPGITNKTRISFYDQELSILESQVELLRIQVRKKELKEEVERLQRQLNKINYY